MKSNVWSGSSLALGALLIGLTAGCQTFSSKQDYKTMIARFYLEANPAEGYTEVLTLPLSKVMVPVDPAPVFTELDVNSVDLVNVDMGLCLSFNLTAAAARDLYRLSVNNLGSRLVMTLNGAPYGVRLMDSPLSFGNIMIFVEMPNAELEALVPDLQDTATEIQKQLAKG